MKDITFILELKKSQLKKIVSLLFYRTSYIFSSLSILVYFQVWRSLPNEFGIFSNYQVATLEIRNRHFHIITLNSWFYDINICILSYYSTHSQNFRRVKILSKETRVFKVLDFIPQNFFLQICSGCNFLRV